MSAVSEMDDTSDMSDTKQTADEILLTPRERTVVNAALEIADGFAALAVHDHDAADKHFAESRRLMDIAQRVGQGA